MSLLLGLLSFTLDSSLVLGLCMLSLMSGGRREAVLLVDEMDGSFEAVEY